MSTGRRVLLGLAMVAAVVVVSFVVTPPPAASVPVSAVDFSIGACADQCARDRLAASASAAATRRAVLSDGLLNCRGAGLGCTNPSFEQTTTAGAWQIVGLLDRLQVGMGIGGADDVTVSQTCTWTARRSASLDLHVGSVRYRRTVTPRDMAGGSKLSWHLYSGEHASPQVVAGYRWLRHDYYLTGTHSMAMSGDRRYFGTEWEIQTGVLGAAQGGESYTSLRFYDAAEMGDLDRLLAPFLGVTRPDPSRSADDMPPPYACRDDGTPHVPAQLPPPSALGGDVVGTWSSQSPGPAAVARPEERLLMIVGACLPPDDHGFTAGGRHDVPAPRMRITVTRHDGRPAAEADITCSAALSNGLVLPEVGGPFQVAVSAGDARSWEVFAYAIPRVDVSRTGGRSVS